LRAQRELTLVVPVAVTLFLLVAVAVCLFVVVLVVVAILVLVLLELVHAAVATVEGRLEVLEDLVALRFVDGNVVADQDPVGPLELLHVEDLGVDRRGVVDDHEDFGLRAEVGARAADQILEVVASVLCHRRVSIPQLAGNQAPRSRSCRSTSVSTSSGSSPRRALRSLRAMTS